MCLKKRDDKRQQNLRKYQYRPITGDLLSVVCALVVLRGVLICLFVGYLLHFVMFPHFHICDIFGLFTFGDFEVLMFWQFLHLSFFDIVKGLSFPRNWC